jgi:hypothetical protein
MSMWIYPCKWLPFGIKMASSLGSATSFFLDMSCFRSNSTKILTAIIFLGKYHDYKMPYFKSICLIKYHLVIWNIECRKIIVCYWVLKIFLAVLSLLLSQQMLSHLSQAPWPFFTFFYFSDRVSKFCQGQNQTVILLPMASMHSWEWHHHIYFIDWGGVSLIFLPGQSDLEPQSSRHHPLG